MKKYYVIIMCLLIIAGVTSCATSEDKSAAHAFEQAEFSVTEPI